MTIKNKEQMRVLAGKCKCGEEMDFRFVDLREDENNPASRILGYLIYSYCEKCKIVYMQMLHNEVTKPELDVDFEIDYNEVAKGSKKMPKVKSK